VHQGPRVRHDEGDGGGALAGLDQSDAWKPMGATIADIRSHCDLRKQFKEARTTYL
jgi:hypothetical protein